MREDNFMILQGNIQVPPSAPFLPSSCPHDIRGLLLLLNIVLFPQPKHRQSQQLPEHAPFQAPRDMDSKVDSKAPFSRTRIWPSE